MKKALLIVSLALLASTAQASVCSELAISAERIMESRQVGVPLSRMLEIAKGAGPFADFLKAVTLDAYSQPRYSSQEYRIRSAQDFRNNWEIACYKVNGTN